MKQLMLFTVLILSFFSINLPQVTHAQTSCSDKGTYDPLEMVIGNMTTEAIRVYWVNYSCQEELQGEFQPGDVIYQSTYDGHEWAIRGAAGQIIKEFSASSATQLVTVGLDSFNPEPLTTNCSSQPTNEDVTLTVINNTDDQLLLFWVEPNTCAEILQSVVQGKNSYIDSAYGGHDWVIRYLDGRVAGHVVTVSGNNRIIIDPPPQQPQQAPPTVVAQQPTAVPAPATTTPPTTVPTATTDTTTTTATTDPTTPTNEQTGTFPVIVSECVVQPVTADLGLDGYYGKYCDYNGLRILSSSNVSDGALQQQWLIVANMLFNRPDIVEALIRLNFSIVVIAENELVSDIPELVYLRDDGNFNPQTSRAFSKIFEEPRLMAVGEENLLCSTTDQYRGESTSVYHVANLILTALALDMDATMLDRVRSTRDSAISQGIWNGSWVTESNSNYWNNGIQAYFNSAYDALFTGPQDDYTNTRPELMSYDPALYNLIHEVLGAEDWTPVCPVLTETGALVTPEPVEEVVVEEATEQPVVEETTVEEVTAEEVTVEDVTVEETVVEEIAPAFPVIVSECVVQPVTADLGLDGYYGKYCDYNGLRILSSSNVSDGALQQQWLIVANMLFNRPDIVEALIRLNFSIVVIAENELVSDIPELVYLRDDGNFNPQTSRAFSKIFEEPRLMAVGEENLLCSTTDQYRGESTSVYHVANLILTALALDMDATMLDRVRSTRDSAISQGIWNGSWVTESNSNYWNNGIQAYFNSAYDALFTGPQDDYTNTRAELMSYDPALYNLIHEVLGAEDWTPVCP